MIQVKLFIIQNCDTIIGFKSKIVINQKPINKKN